VQKKDLASKRLEFSSRLTMALARVGIDASPSVVARRFNARAGEESITRYGARKWLFGEALPSQARLEILAQWLCVTPQWLRFGQGDIDDAGQIIPDAPVIDRTLLQDLLELQAPSQRLVRDLVSLLVPSS